MAKLQDKKQKKIQLGAARSTLVHSYLTSYTNYDGSCDTTWLRTSRNSSINSYITL